MKWVDANKRLPETSEPVLTCSYTGKGEFFGLYVLYYSDGEWWRSMDGLWAFEVTHWMSLPKPPKRTEKYHAEHRRIEQTRGTRVPRSGAARALLKS